MKSIPIIKSIIDFFKVKHPVVDLVFDDGKYFISVKPSNRRGYYLFAGNNKDEATRRLNIFLGALHGNGIS